MKIETKYLLGDNCWMMYDNVPITVTIKSCNIEITEGKGGKIDIEIKYTVFRGHDLIGLVPQHKLFQDRNSLKAYVFDDLYWG